MKKLDVTMRSTLVQQYENAGWKVVDFENFIMVWLEGLYFYIQIGHTSS